MANKSWYWLALGAATAISTALTGRTRLVADSVLDKVAPYTGTFYYDLEDMGRSRGYLDRQTRPGLQLVIVPERVSADRLLVRVEVWNHANEPQPVYPIDPATYVPEFRDGVGKTLQGDLLPPALPVGRTLEELPSIPPGNCLSANYLFPTFYRRFNGAKGVHCHVAIGIYYYLDSKYDRTAKFALSSDWVNVPQPP